MRITEEELVKNTDQYLEAVDKEDVIITRDGKPIAQLSKPHSDKLDTLHSLKGSVESNEDIDLDKVREERILK